MGLLRLYSRAEIPTAKGWRALRFWGRDGRGKGRINPPKLRGRHSIFLFWIYAGHTMAPHRHAQHNDGVNDEKNVLEENTGDCRNAMRW